MTSAPIRNAQFKPLYKVSIPVRASMANNRMVVSYIPRPGKDLTEPQIGPQQQYQAPAQNSPYHPQYSGGNIPYPSQSAPTQVLYEQARQAAVAKANPGNTRRPGLPSQRRPWSGEEENALMAGLDQVKGPHWSQILALYGAKGQINEILKDRNQVQLKDKARNLKLFFLKSNIEVPYYLQCVTGELKTRAPSQAARKEAEERARLASDEEQARFNGILTLANGIQEQPRTNGAPEAPMVSSPGAQSFDSQDGPEEFQVVEPEKDENSISTPRTSDELLRQQLLAANASSDGSDDSVQRSGFTAVAT
jgi:protein TBF1